jgi:hypothetical protein
MLEHRPVLVPADAGTWIVADQQSLSEFVCCKPGKSSSAASHFEEPVRHWFGWREAEMLEVIVPAIAMGQALPSPLLEPKGGEITAIDISDELSFLHFGQQIVPRRKARNHRHVE